MARDLGAALGKQAASPHCAVGSTFQRTQSFANGALVFDAAVGRLSIGVRLQDDLQRLLAQRVHVAMAATAFNARPGRPP